MIDLLLVTPPSRIGVYQDLSQFAAIEPPVWSGLIASFLLRRGFSVKILDAEAEGMSTLRCAQTIREIRPRLAAFSIYGHQPSASTQCMPGATETTAFLEDSGIPLLAFGTHPSALPQHTLYEGFDYVAKGEGVYTIWLLLQALRSGIKPRSGFGGIPGLWQKNDLPPLSAPLMAQPLDGELPGQAWSLLNLHLYRPLFWHQWTGQRDGGYASVQTSLGCPFKCTFCCINTPFDGPGFRTWSPENVANQIETLVKVHGITNIKIPDEMFVLNKKHVGEVCAEILRRNLGPELNMWAYARVDTVKDEALLCLMRSAGFRWLGIGIESASKHVRDGIEKGRFGNEEIIQACKRVEQAGLHIGANYIFGLPDDTLESMSDTFKLALKINAAHANFYCAMAYPGSPLHKIAQQKGWPLPEDGPGWLGYSQHAYETLPLPTDTLTSEQVLDFRDAAFLAYHTGVNFLAKLQREFGNEAVDDMNRITALGKPKRRHRDPDYVIDVTKDLKPEDLF